MRTEQQMYDLILDYAKKDEKVRAVYLNGSRANPNAPKDKYMDFDVHYIVTDLEYFKSHNNWIDVFGERLILQMPEAMRNPYGAGDFSWQMLFTDGNRIDLTLIPIDKPEIIENDSATVVLLDKDGILPKFPPASDKDYIVRKPSELFYTSCCNNFLWCMQNVAKGIVRDELPYVMGMYNYIISDELNDMVSWYIGIKTNFSIATGKKGKYFKKYLSPELYEKYTKIFPHGNYEDIWDCIFTACDFFRIIANEVGDYLGYTYNKQDDEGIIKYLHMMKIEKIVNL